MSVNPYVFTVYNARFGRSESNVHLRTRKVDLQGVVIPVLDAPGVDTWEDEGGALAPPPYEVTVTDLYRQNIRARGPRKQTAARAVRPINTIKVDKVKPELNHVLVGAAILEDKSKEEIKRALRQRIAELKQKLAK